MSPDISGIQLVRSPDEHEILAPKASAICLGGVATLLLLLASDVQRYPSAAEAVYSSHDLVNRLR